MSSIQQSNSLGRKEKLKSRKQIDLLFRARTFFTQPPIRMFYLVERGGSSTGARPTADTGIQKPEQISGRYANEFADIESSGAVKAGFSASKRFFKHANKRNRVKRLMREVFRKNKHPLVALAAEHGYEVSLFFLYGHKELPTYEQIETKLLPLIAKLQQALQKD